MTERILSGHRKSVHADHRASHREAACCGARRLTTTWREVLDACAKNGVAMECNAYPDRLDLCDVHLRMAKQRGVKVVISTDSHTHRET